MTPSPPGRSVEGAGAPGPSPTGSSASGLPVELAAVSPLPYRSLNPTTKVVIAICETIVAFVLGGFVAPVLVLLAVLGSAALSRALRAAGVVAAVASPVIGSILLINTFLLPGATDPIVRLGPLAPTHSGLRFGIEVALRLMAMSLALALVYLTTEMDDLLADVERRGFGRRATFVVGATLQTVPRTIERAAEIVDAQRARGLDTEGRFWRRARGVVPLAAPLIFGALTDVEERTMALEARGFSAPGKRTPLRVPRDRARERALRWALAALVVAVLALHVAGVAAIG